MLFCRGRFDNGPVKVTYVGTIEKLVQGHPPAVFYFQIALDDFSRFGPQTADHVNVRFAESVPMPMAKSPPDDQIPLLRRSPPALLALQLKRGVRPGSGRRPGSFQ